MSDNIELIEVIEAQEFCNNANEWINTKTS